MEMRCGGKTLQVEGRLKAAPRRRPVRLLLGLELSQLSQGRHPRAPYTRARGTVT